MPNDNVEINYNKALRNLSNEFAWSKLGKPEKIACLQSIEDKKAQVDGRKSYKVEEGGYKQLIGAAISARFHHGLPNISSIPVASEILEHAGRWEVADYISQASMGASLLEYLHQKPNGKVPEHVSLQQMGKIEAELKDINLITRTYQGRKLEDIEGLEFTQILGDAADRFHGELGDVEKKSIDEIKSKNSSYSDLDRGTKIDLNVLHTNMLGAPLTDPNTTRIGLPFNSIYGDAAYLKLPKAEADKIKGMYQKPDGSCYLDFGGKKGLIVPVPGQFYAEMIPFDKPRSVEKTMATIHKAKQATPEQTHPNVEHVGNAESRSSAAHSAL